MSDPAVQTDNISGQQKPGQILKAAREKKELSLQDIATQLNLHSNVILALEADDTHDLPAMAYVYGYIRSYARIVDLDANQLIQLYENNPKAPPEILPDVKPHAQISSSDKPVKAVTYLVTFGLVLLVLAWWQSHFIVGENFLTNSESTPQGGALSYTYDIVIHPDTPFLEKNNTVEDELAELPQYGSDSSTQADVSTADDQNTSNTLITETTQGSATEVLTPSFDNISIGPDSISLNVIEESWIEVYDANKQKIYMGIAKTGNKLNFNGVAPFSIILGNSTGVEVTFNDKPFDHTPYENAGVARFKLGE